MRLVVNSDLEQIDGSTLMAMAGKGESHTGEIDGASCEIRLIMTTSSAGHRVEDVPEATHHAFW